MSGMVIPGTPIAVDFWKITHAQQVRLFFLSHLHADHMEGLTSSWRLPIYTSETNAALLKLKFNFAPGVVKSLEVGETYQLSLDAEDEYILSVTVLDANHVPGAVMFLFQGYFGNYLYCADMRWYPELLDHPVLKSVVESKELDCVFLDNTFSASYCDFPSREEAKKEVFNIIDSSPESEIKIGVRSLGKEALLESVAARYQERILVSQEKYAVLRALKAPDVYTTDPKQARIHAVPLNQITSQSHSKWNESTSTVSIILTALFVGWCHGPYSASASRGMYVVPYSDHSSYSELQEMVACLAPKQVLPIVRQWSCKGWWSEDTAPNQSIKWDMSFYEHLLTKPPPDYFIIPKAVEKAMKEGSRSFYHPELRQCRLRHGLMPRPRLAKRIPRGVVFTSPELRTVSPTQTNSTSIDDALSMPSTPTHTFYPLKFCETNLNSYKQVIHTTEMKVPESSSSSVPSASSSTQTLPCTLCTHNVVTNEYVPSCRDCGTQTLKQTQLSSKKRASTKETSSMETFGVENIYSLLGNIKYESVVSTEMLICELEEECKNKENFQELLKKAHALCDNLCLISSLH
ncbi:5' exonuclease Apollo-like [Macrobrachium rosenbergii]|uniref:5' exonuclease Apollo-like n=1 Tax=Macrobrachium rosenbergii TaxID=79674 RepID=UPI0034D43F79